MGVWYSPTPRCVKRLCAGVRHTRLFYTTNWFSKEVSVTPEEKEKAKQNKRTGLILLSVAAVFFIGILIRKVMEPSILSLVN
jgi:hypothetical protein